MICSFILRFGEVESIVLAQGRFLGLFYSIIYITFSIITPQHLFFPSYCKYHGPGVNCGDVSMFIFLLLFSYGVMGEHFSSYVSGPERVGQ